MSITIYGAGDDLIEIDGAISEEFQYVNSDGGDLLSFSDGTILRIHYSKQGVWRIYPVKFGRAKLFLTQALEHDDDNYSDSAMLLGDIEWVVHGINIAS